MSNLTPPQLRLLMRPINPNRVSNLRGMSHVEAWDIRRQLIRTFGFVGWNFDIISLDMVREVREEKISKAGNPYTGWTVVYRATGRLVVKDASGREMAHWEDGAIGAAENQPSYGDAHDLATKTALSQALKRCAANLGDQFGLSLYNDGSQDAVVQFSAAHPPEQATASDALHPEPDDAPVRPEQQPSTPVDAPAAAPEPDWETPPSAPSAPEVPAAVDSVRQAALEEMRAAAAKVGFTAQLPGEFLKEYNHAIDFGTTAEFRQARDLMLGVPA